MKIVTTIKEELTARTTKSSPFIDAGFIFPFEQIKMDINALHGASLGEFVAGVFLSCGTGREGYQIEFTFENVSNARVFCEVLSQYEIFPKLTLANGLAIVRVGSCDCVCNLLALMGANNALMQLNNEIALRELRNNANRRANCDTGNIEKQVEASNKQIEIIKRLIENDEIKRLPCRLQETALARIAHPDATYEELAKVLSITKSGVVHRLHKIICR